MELIRKQVRMNQMGKTVTDQFMIGGVIMYQMRKVTWEECFPVREVCGLKRQEEWKIISV